MGVVEKGLESIPFIVKLAGHKTTCPFEEYDRINIKD